MTVALVSAPIGRRTAGAPDVYWADAIGSRVQPDRLEGVVEATFDRACNLALESGDMVTLLASGVGNVAHGIRLAHQPRLDGILRRGMRAEARDGRLMFDDGAVVVALAGAHRWICPLIPGMGGESGNWLPSALLAREFLRDHASTQASEVLRHVLGSPQPPTPLTARISTVFPDLASATISADRGRALKAVSRLVGLGPGLTPAGDDFVIGWLAGLTLAANTPARLEFLRSMCAEVRFLRDATTQVGRQHLSDACALQFSERLSDVCTAIASGAPMHTLAGRLTAQLAVGATSGADAAAGLMLALFACGSHDTGVEGVCHAHPA
jgi:hypothetical protein